MSNNKMAAFAATTRFASQAGVKEVNLETLAQMIVKALGPTHLQVGDCFVLGTRPFEDEKLSKDATASRTKRAEESVKKNGTTPAKVEPCSVIFFEAHMCTEKGEPLNRSKRVYRGVFERTVYTYASDPKDGRLKSTGHVVASGSAIDEWHKHQSVDEAFKALQGKILKVVDKLSVDTIDYYDRSKTDTRNVYKIDIIGKAN